MEQISFKNAQHKHARRHTQADGDQRKATQMIYFLSRMTTTKKRQESLRKLINSRGNWQGVFFMLGPRSPRQLESFWRRCGHDPCGRDEPLVFKPVVASVLPLSTLISCPLSLSSLCFPSANPQSQIRGELMLMHTLIPNVRRPIHQRGVRSVKSQGLERNWCVWRVQNFTWL